MNKTATCLSFFLLLFLSLYTGAQEVSDSLLARRTEDIPVNLRTFMGPNLTTSQTIHLERFTTCWNEGRYNEQQRTILWKMLNSLEGKKGRPKPHFAGLLETLEVLRNVSAETTMHTEYLEILGRITALQGDLADVVKNYEALRWLLQDNALFISGPVRWEPTSVNYSFEFDSLFHIVYSATDLVCKNAQDSIIVHETSGKSTPSLAIWKGNNGLVTWERAGYSPEDLFVRLGNYELDLTKTSITDTSAVLTHREFFPEPVTGKLFHRVSMIRDPQRARYPEFETNKKRFRIDEIYQGIDYEGGVRLSGASTTGFGERYRPATIDVYRNDTLYLHLSSMNYLFTPDGIASQGTTATFYLEQDSIYHSNIALRYTVKTKLLSLYKTSEPVTDSPFENTFHQLDMHIDRLEWDLNGSEVKLTRPRGATYGVVRFESVDYFKETDFFRIMGMSNTHPLYLIRNFSDYYYSESFPVEEFAKWLKKPLHQVISLCIDLAKEGFLHYDRSNREITVKPRLYAYIESFAKKKDYDVMRIISETEAPRDNASLNLHNKRITINGVPRISLSDSQNVAIYPSNQQIILSENRDFRFNGVVESGMMTLFGKNFDFRYDTFKINLGIIDSIRIATYTGDTDEYGRAVISYLSNNIKEGAGELLIDHPMNKSGLTNIPEYPIFNSNKPSYVYYDRIPGLEGVYPRDSVYYVLDPYSFNNADRLTREKLTLAGTFYSGGIFPPVRQPTVVQEDQSLGFNLEVPGEGLPLYGGKGRVYGNIQMSNKGLKSSGAMDYLTASLQSEDYSFYPDSMLTRAQEMTISADASGRYPPTQAKDLDIQWYPKEERFHAENRSAPFEMFGNNTSLDGFLTLNSRESRGGGTVNTEDSRIEARDYSFTQQSIQADTANYYLKSASGEGSAFIAENAQTKVDFTEQKSTFTLNTDTSMIKFPEVQYICTMKDFVYDMNRRILDMRQPGIPTDRLLIPEELKALGDEDLTEPNFFSRNNPKDTISFTSGYARYLVETGRIEANNIQYLRIADAMIQPEDGVLTIGKYGAFDEMQNAFIIANKNHIIYHASVNIASSKNYTASGLLDYNQPDQDPLPIAFSEITVNDSLHTVASGNIQRSDGFTFSPAFKYEGKVELDARKELLTFDGAAAILNPCPFLDSKSLRFTGEIDPEYVMIPYAEESKDINGNRIFSGHFVTNDSTHVFTAFLSPRKKYSDNHMVVPSGFLYYDKATEIYKVSTREKLSDNTSPDNLVTLNTTNCDIYGEGELNLGVDFDLFTMKNYGSVLYRNDSAKVTFDAILGLDFYFSGEAMQIMADELRFLPTARPVDLGRDLYTKAVKYYIGKEQARDFQINMNIGGVNAKIPEGLQHTVLLSQVHLEWNPDTRSYQSVGKLGIGSVDGTQINIMVDGYLEIQKRRTGDIVDLYIKADDATWYYFGYARGNMMALSGNNSFLQILREKKAKDRRHPDANARHPYTYMLGVEGRLRPIIRKFERRQQGLDGTENEE